MADGPKRVGDLEIDMDLEFQQRDWRFERFGWAAMFLVAAAALTGVLGHGPLSRAEAGAAGGPLRVRYDRFIRHSSPAPITFEIAAGAAPDSLARIRIDHDYLARFDLDHIVPEPRETTAGDEYTIYTFHVADPSRPARVTFALMPLGFGRLRPRVGLGDGAPLELSQFALP